MNESNLRLKEVPIEAGEPKKFLNEEKVEIKRRPLTKKMGNYKIF